MGATYKQQFEVPSSSGRRNTTYTVSIKFDETWECSCMNWTRTMPRQDCKHILKIKLLSLSGNTTVIHPNATIETPTGRKFR